MPSLLLRNSSHLVRYLASLSVNVVMPAMMYTSGPLRLTMTAMIVKYKNKLVCMYMKGRREREEGREISRKGEGETEREREAVSSINMNSRFL